MFGVFRYGWPATPRQSHRWSSVRTKTTFGRAAGVPAARGTPAAGAAAGQTAASSMIRLLLIKLLYGPRRCGGAPEFLQPDVLVLDVPHVLLLDDLVDLQA